MHMEARIEFPNGDFGKVSMTYEGLNRYCFGCKRLSHDIYSCLDLSAEEREKKIKELREANELGPQRSMSYAPSGQLENYKGIARNNKRPRSPNGDVYQRSPTGEKRHKDSGSYWTTKGYLSRDAPPKMMERRREERDERHTRYQQKPTVWNRLDDHDRAGGQDRKKTMAPNWRPRRNPAELQRGGEPYRPKERHYSHLSQASHQVWRPRAQLTEGKSCSPSRTLTNPKHPSALTPEKEESQQTISGGLQERSGLDGQGSGVLVVHKNETSEEKMRRLKGKSIMLEGPASKTPVSTHQRFPQAMLTRDRGTVVIREGGLRTPPPAPRLFPPPLRLRDETEDPSLELVNLMNSKQIDEMVLTREEEAEVDKLVEDFGDVVMDEDMLQNDDLLVDEPGQDAEIIDAISQLSPAHAVNQHTREISAAPKEPEKSNAHQVKKKCTGFERLPLPGTGQNRMGVTEERKK
ncbi:hypothetical protein HID58_008050, partial [Brassica napus]